MRWSKIFAFFLLAVLWKTYPFVQCAGAGWTTRWPLNAARGDETRLGDQLVLRQGHKQARTSQEQGNVAAWVTEAPLSQILLTPAALGFFDQSSDPDKDHCADESHNNRTNHASSLPQAE